MLASPPVSETFGRLARVLDLNLRNEIADCFFRGNLVALGAKLTTICSETLKS